MDHELPGGDAVTGKWLVRRVVVMATLVATASVATVAPRDAAAADVVSTPSSTIDGTTEIVLDGPTTIPGTIEPQFAAPVLVLDRYEVSPNDHVAVTIAGFTSGFVTATICGNDGRRGSTDCAQTASKSVELHRNGSSTVMDLPVSTPPTPCPCLVRVASASNDEIAVASLTIVGHPVAPVVGSRLLEDVLSATINAKRASDGARGWLRSSLGGATAYDVTVVVKNRSTEPVKVASITGRVGRGRTDVKESLEIEAPGVIEPGATWSTVVSARLPAPVFGRAVWRMEIASTTGPTLVATDTTSHLPGSLIVLLLILAADLTLLAVRFARRRWTRPAASPRYPGGFGEPIPELEA